MSASEDPPLLSPTLQPLGDRLIVALVCLNQVLEHPRFIDAREPRALGLPGQPAGDIHNVAHRERFSTRPLLDKPVEAFPLTHDPLTGEAL
jgi:hypothetical protein